MGGHCGWQAIPGTAIRRKSHLFFYTYVPQCANGDWYIGSTDDLKRRLQEHEEGKCQTTKSVLPVELVYYEACRNLQAAREREQQLKTGFGRGYLSRRLFFET